MDKLSSGSLRTVVSVHVNISQSSNPASQRLTICLFSPSRLVFQSLIFDLSGPFAQALCNVDDEDSKTFAYLFQTAYQKSCVLACTFRLPL